MSTADYVPDLAAALDRLVSDDSFTLDWDDVVGRAGVRQRGRTTRRVRLVIAVALLLLLLTGVATATYLLQRGSPHAGATGGGLTIIAPPGIIARRLDGRVRVVWHCPDARFCGDVTSVAWAPDGRRLAFTVDEVGGRSGNIGLHILDTQTGRDLQIPEPHFPDPIATQPWDVLRGYVDQEQQVLGCEDPTDVAWAPHGARLAYSCQLGADGRTGIVVLRADGTDPTPVPTGTAAAVQPTWSPDGTRIAFATSPGVPAGADDARSNVYVVDLDGAHRRLIARHAAAPAWSPDGRKIAYWALGTCRGIRLATPRGADVTPRLRSAGCRVIGKPGMPVWSPDGRKIAIGAYNGVDLMNADGTHFAQVMLQVGRGVFGDARPNWGPDTRGRRLSRHVRPNCPACN